MDELYRKGGGTGHRGNKRTGNCHKKWTVTRVHNFQNVILPPVMKYLHLYSKVRLWVCSSWVHHSQGSPMSPM
jgi:hypothetical protein